MTGRVERKRPDGDGRKKKIVGRGTLKEQVFVPDKKGGRWSNLNPWRTMETFLGVASIIIWRGKRTKIRRKGCGLT